MMWKVAHSSFASSIQFTVRSKIVWPIVIETEHETAVHLDAVIVQYPGAAQVILRGGRFLARLHQVIQTQ